jgi:hypothetical protein
MGIVVKSRRHPSMTVSTAYVAVAITLLSCFYMPKSHPDENTIWAVQDEVYAAVVRDMIRPVNGEARVTQLVFGDEVLSDGKAGGDIDECKEEVRRRQDWAVDAPPYDSLIDKIYRFLTRGWADSSVRTETVENFLVKSCSTGHLSRTFPTDLPRSFVASANVRFEGWPIQKNGPPSFEKLFPGAGGVISLSRVGFDSGQDEAMVSVSFVCGGLCGEGWHYILKKRRGKWEVAAKRMIWVS